MKVNKNWYDLVLFNWEINKMANDYMENIYNTTTIHRPDLSNCTFVIANPKDKVRYLLRRIFLGKKLPEGVKIFNTNKQRGSRKKKSK